MRIKFSLKLFLVFFFFAKIATAAENQHLNHASDHPQIFHAFTVEADTGEARDGKARVLDVNGWIGGDINRLWLKSEQKTFGKYDNKSEVQALYSRNISQFWDAQIGVRHDFSTDFSSQKPTYLSIGLEGLAPYMFETNAQIFLSDQGNYSARLKQEIDISITQKLITQPYFEAEVFAQDVLSQQVKSGLAEVEIGLLTRYEITRKFAPYFALRYHTKTFGTANLARQIGERVDNFIVSGGVRLRF